MTLLDDVTKPPFTPEELRVLGCLMEKQLTTPNNYPLTINSLTLACNQKTSREPVMNLKEGDVGHIARGLVEFGWIVIQNSERAQRIAHRVNKKLTLNSKQQAILCVLLLRGPQTLSEIKQRTERIAELSGTDIQQQLEAWTQGQSPLITRLAANVGQREDRYYHSLGTPEHLAALHQENLIRRNAFLENSATLDSKSYEHLVQRLETLERRVAQLEELVK